MAEATDGLDVGLVIYNAGAAEPDDGISRRLGSRTRCGRSSWHASGRSRWPGTSPRRCASAVAAASSWSDRWPACPGASLLAVYSAVKAFNVNFAEGLWAELRPHGVDVCCTPLGMTYTEAFQRMGVRLRPDTVMLSEDAAREIIENIGNGPTYPVGESNRTMASMSLDRRSSHAWSSSRAPHLLISPTKQGTAG